MGPNGNGNKDAKNEGRNESTNVDSEDVGTSLGPGGAQNQTLVVEGSNNTLMVPQPLQHRDNDNHSTNSAISDSSVSSERMHQFNERVMTEVEKATNQLREFIARHEEVEVSNLAEFVDNTVRLETDFNLINADATNLTSYVGNLVQGRSSVPSIPVTDHTIINHEQYSQSEPVTRSPSVKSESAGLLDNEVLSEDERRQRRQGKQTVTGKNDEPNNKALYVFQRLTSPIHGQGTPRELCRVSSRYE